MLLVVVLIVFAPVGWFVAMSKKLREARGSVNAFSALCVKKNTTPQGNWGAVHRLASV